MMTDYHNDNNNSNTAFHDDGCTRPNWKERGSRNTMDRDNSSDNVPLPFMPEPDRLDRGGRHHHRSRRQQQHGRHQGQDSLQLLDEFMTMERMHNDDYHFSPQRRQEEPHELYPQYAPPSSTSRHSWDGPDSSSNRREAQKQQQQPRGQPHGRHRDTTNRNTAVSMDHHDSLERNTSAPYGSYGEHGPMPHGSSSSNLQSSFDPYGIHNNGSNISPHQSHHYHTSEEHQPYAHNNQQQQHYQPHYVVSTSTGSTPGPIVTSYPYAVPSGSHHGMPPSYGNAAYYGSPSWGPPIHQQQQQLPLPPPIVEYIYNIQSSDVLCGRGGATNSHSGNRSFRSLVKRHQDKYLKAKKRDKPGVAALIVDLIRNRGGRFLRRHDDANHGNSGGNMSGSGQHHVLWVDIGNERAREKTCQALREGAPELRRRRSRGASTSSSSSDEDNDDDRKSPLQKRKVMSYLEDEENNGGGGGKAGMSQKVKCEQSTLKRSLDDTAVGGGGGGRDCNVDDAAHAHHTPVVTMSMSASASAPASTDVRDDLECMQNEQDVPHSQVDHDGNGNGDDCADDEEGPLMIRPCPILMRRPVCAISISELSARDQELYMNDFLPPRSNICDLSSKSRNSSSSSRTSRQVVLMAREYTSVCSDHDDDVDNNDDHDDDDDDDDDDTVDANECWEV